MAMEKPQKDFIALIEKNGFTEAAKTTDTQNTVYHREWTREVEVLETMDEDGVVISENGLSEMITALSSNMEYTPS